MAKPGEFELIEKYFAPLAGQGSFALTDDAALLTPRKNHDLVITTDAIAQGVHFFAEDPPDLIARKALRVNLSDLAAKGANPFSYSLALGLSDNWDEEWIAAFAKGLAQDHAEFGLTLSGGDTFKTSGGFVISITALGEIESGQYTSRGGAKMGDHLYVTGTIGDAALGLKELFGEMPALAAEHAEFLVSRYHLPQPRIALADLVRKHATAAMDVSDGLIGDCAKLAKASHTGCEIMTENVPLSEAASAYIAHDSKWLETALTGGDDYEILFSASPQNQTRIEEFAEQSGCVITRIGRVVQEKGVKVFDVDGETMEFASPSYNHA